MHDELENANPILQSEPHRRHCVVRTFRWRLGKGKVQLLSQFQYTNIVRVRKVTALLNRARFGTLIVAVALLVYTLSSVHVVTAEMNPLSFAAALPGTYWIGLGLFMISYCLAMKSATTRNVTALGLVYVVILVFYVEGLVLVFQEPLFADVPFHLENTLTQWGHLGLSSSSGFTNFIGGYFAMGVIIHLTGISPWQFARFFPILSSLVLCISVYALAIEFSPTFYSTVAPVFLASGLWEWVNGVSTLAYGLMLYSSVLLVCGLLLRKRRYYVPLIILLTASSFSSPEGPIYAILFLVVLVFLKGVGHLINRNETEFDRRFLFTTFFAIGTYGLWWIYASSATLAPSFMLGISSLSGLPSDIVRLLSGHSQIVVGTTTQGFASFSPAMKWASVTKYFVSALELMAVLGVVMRIRRFGRLSAFLFAMCFSPLLFGLYGLFSPTANFQVDIIAVLLLGASVISATTLARFSSRRWTVVLLAIIVLSAFLMPITRYSVSSDSYFSSAELNGVDTTMRFSNLYASNPFVFSTAPVTWLTFPQGNLTSSSIQEAASTLIPSAGVIFDSLDLHYWETHVGTEQPYALLRQYIASSRNLVYSNPDFQLFFSQ